jgi:hypothetical protein
MLALLAPFGSGRRQSLVMDKRCAYVRFSQDKRPQDTSARRRSRQCPQNLHVTYLPYLVGRDLECSERLANALETAAARMRVGFCSTYVF